ncbi:MAG TPA: response regulator transcription factor [Acidimicrobiia bacterium]
MITAVYPSPPSEPVSDGLDLAGTEVIAITDLTPENDALAKADVLVIELAEQPMRRIREATRIAETLAIPVLAIVDGPTLAMIEGADTITDFVLEPVNALELRLRINRLAAVDSDETVSYKDLELNPLHFRANLAGEPMDLTYMEYELLRFLVQNPGRVWSREQLLNKVWGYEYYGGARTVDVHIRRLRSKLGEERSSWITTVRSVGYRFG